jgi:hypothetical protein
MHVTAPGHAIALPPDESTLAAATGAAFPAEVLPAGTGRGWTPTALLTTLILLAWGRGSESLSERFAAARAALLDPGPGQTYQGFVKAWRRGGLRLAYAAAAHLRQAMQALADAAWTLEGWVVFAADGSRFDLPRTAEHLRVFGTASQTGSGPQLWITTLWHLGLGLPWAWRVGRADASERTHLRRLLPTLPLGALLVADAGYTGYELLAAILASPRHFLVRVGRGVQLLARLGYAQEQGGGVVYLWPTYAQHDQLPPLVLRLIRLRRPGDRRKKVYLLTSVRDAAALSDAWAGELYRRRWGIELLYRQLKQTLDARKLASHAPAQALVEIQGLVLGLTLLGLWQQQALRAAGVDPRRASVAGALRVVRAGLRRPEVAQPWAPALARAVQDSYRRRAKTRVLWPRKKAAAPPPGRPRLRLARRTEIRLAPQLAAA